MLDLERTTYTSELDIYYVTYCQNGGRKMDKETSEWKLRTDTVEFR